VPLQAEIEQFKQEVFERGGALADELRSGKTLTTHACCAR
jgi:hypothetical protein